MAFESAPAALPKRCDVAIIGSGFSGLCVAIGMKRAGMHDLVILEQAARIGGTWRDNHYPGAACDIASNLYSFSFEPNPHWSRLYPQQHELQSYVEHCADKYGLRSHLHCKREVTQARFDAATKSWRITIDGSHDLLARVLVSATGGLSRPSIPAFDGMQDFNGPVFHSARWRHDVDLSGLRVAVVGTGASAVQFVPQIAPKVGHLTLFQRTAAWIIPKPDRALSANERRRLARYPLWQRLLRAAVYVQREWRVVLFTRWPRLLKRLQPSVLRYMQHQVADPALSAKLTPSYVMGCKRILLSNDFYPTLTRPKVRVVTDRIARIDAHGIHTRDGAFHTADVIILATGFQVGDAGTPFPIYGQDGIELDRVWAKGPQAYLGTTVSGFPNLFLMTGPNTGLGHNSMIYMIESQARYVIDALLTMRKRRLQAVDVSPAVQREFNTAVQRRLAGSVWATGGCKSWYLSADGGNSTLWPDFTFKYRFLTRRFDMACYRTWPQADVAA
jgi:cation diffusion facilitator CzcD-associated flavoprotein CzcO